MCLFVHYQQRWQNPKAWQDILPCRVAAEEGSVLHQVGKMRDLTGGFALALRQSLCTGCRAPVQKYTDEPGIASEKT